ncbi:MAG TPA: polyprenyl synthetase family protein [Thermoleophilia bacterium]|nr:polyprenyl synthetase family protein [Thermoleophilia bacterium]HQG03495.1 polyprenyl synthetase family protein [Thermoleophilia bacterium]
MAHQDLSWRTVVQRRRYSDGLDAVEERLSTVAGTYAEPLGSAARSLLGAGGKRVRPLLTLLCASRRAPLAAAVVHAATAAELLHMATLVHDDVLDRAELRRGRATVAHEYGVETAVSTGNFLLARAFAELALTGDGAAVALLSKTAVGLSEGEVLQRQEAYDVTLGVDAYRRRCERKTADLFAAAARLGALLSGIGERQQLALGEYGRLLGLAFQVFDDILDLDGDEDLTGKRLGADIRDGTVTLPLIYALETRPDLGPRLRDGGRLDEAGVAALIAEVRATGAIARARATATGFIERAQRLLSACSDDVERDLLGEVARSVVDRYA